MTIIKCINFGHIILAPPTMLVKIRHWSNDLSTQLIECGLNCQTSRFLKLRLGNYVVINPMVDLPY